MTTERAILQRLSQCRCVHSSEPARCRLQLHALSSCARSQANWLCLALLSPVSKLRRWALPGVAASRHAGHVSNAQHGQQPAGQAHTWAAAPPPAAACLIKCCLRQARGQGVEAQPRTGGGAGALQGGSDQPHCRRVRGRHAGRLRGGPPPRAAAGVSRTGRQAAGAAGTGANCAKLLPLSLPACML